MPTEIVQVIAGAVFSGRTVPLSSTIYQLGDTLYLALQVNSST
jgi:hypothetical protein